MFRVWASRDGRYQVFVDLDSPDLVTCLVKWKDVESKQNMVAVVALATWDQVGDPLPSQFLKELKGIEPYLWSIWDYWHPSRVN